MCVSHCNRLLSVVVALPLVLPDDICVPVCSPTPCGGTTCDFDGVTPCVDDDDCKVCSTAPTNVTCNDVNDCEDWGRCGAKNGPFQNIDGGFAFPDITVTGTSFPVAGWFPALNVRNVSLLVLGLLAGGIFMIVRQSRRRATEFRSG